MVKQASALAEPLTEPRPSQPDLNPNANLDPALTRNTLEARPRCSGARPAMDRGSAGDGLPVSGVSGFATRSCRTPAAATRECPGSGAAGVVAPCDAGGCAMSGTAGCCNLHKSDGAVASERSFCTYVPHVPTSLALVDSVCANDVQYVWLHVPGLHLH